jgi:toxin YhaV
MVVNGWTLLSHEALNGQLRNLVAEYERARKTDPKGFSGNANVKILAALGRLMLETIPGDPSRTEYRQGKTLGQGRQHWFRAKFFQRFRLFFRYSSRHRVIVYAWVNDANTLRKAGSRTDPYSVFTQMLQAGNPPDDWDDLMKSCTEISAQLLPLIHAKTPDPSGEAVSVKRDRRRKPK